MQYGVENVILADPVKLLGFLLFGIYVLTSLWLLINALAQLHLLWHFKRRKKETDVQPLLHSLPFVSVQVPVYNEKYVIERLLNALAKMDYPAHLWELQILDDSTDETSQLIDAQVPLLQCKGLQVQVLRRDSRQGFKAGALQHGLSFCRGELIAIFDADFIPHPQFIRQLVPHFSDPKTGLVQARWGHLNKDENALTHIQTILLDTHFSVEQSGRHNAGYFINFCGTAGMWRRRCIEDAGGWDGNVLSEDLDLSYRAQLRGWKLVYNPKIEVPAELPAAIQAFKIQQFRWTKGMAQTSRKTLRRVLQAPLPLAKKLHGAFHLLGSFVFVCLFINALLTVPLLVYRNLYEEFVWLTQFSLFTSLNLVFLTLIYYNGTSSIAPQSSKTFFKRYPLFLVVYMGLSVQNAWAVAQGLAGKASPFVRTPKRAGQGGASYLKPKVTWMNAAEMVILAYFGAGILLSIYFNDYFMLLFFVMISTGLGYILYHSFFGATKSLSASMEMPAAKAA